MHLGILASHPVQYQAPWFRVLAGIVDLHVFFAHRQTASEQSNAGFGVPFDWDVDLLSGYSHTFLNNLSLYPSVDYFAGCDTPEIARIIGAQELADKRSRTGAVCQFDAFIVCGWYLKSYMQAVRACRRNGVPVFVRGDSQLKTPRSRLKRAMLEIRQRWLFRRFDGFLSVGHRHREYLEHFGVPSSKIFHVPHFVDNEWFRERVSALKRRRSEFRRGWCIDSDAFVLLFVGKFIPKKRPMDLVMAVAQLLDKRAPEVEDGSSVGSKLHILFVGSGQLGAELRQACQVAFDCNRRFPRPLNSTARSGRVPWGPIGGGAFPLASFTGFLNQSEISSAYNVADCLVLPSDGEETWGLVVNEAMACGIPGIVTDAVGCGPNLVENGRTGFVYPVGDVTGLASCIDNVRSLKRSGYDFEKATRQKVNSYSVTAAVERTLRAIDTTAQRCCGSTDVRSAAL